MYLVRSRRESQAKVPRKLKIGEKKYLSTAKIFHLTQWCPTTLSLSQLWSKFKREIEYYLKSRGALASPSPLAIQGRAKIVCFFIVFLSKKDILASPP
jgi:hypothetical protein